jgi:pyruvate/2-oxoacid:ferredoxin oxidoreductase alpha subunit
LAKAFFSAGFYVQSFPVFGVERRGEKVGLFKPKMFRPFPAEIIRRRLGSARKVAVVDRNFSFAMTTKPI